MAESDCSLSKVYTKYIIRKVKIIQRREFVFIAKAEKSGSAEKCGKKSKKRNFSAKSGTNGNPARVVVRFQSFCCEPIRGDGKRVHPAVKTRTIY